MHQHRHTMDGDALDTTRSMEALCLVGMDRATCLRKKVTWAALCIDVVTRRREYAEDIWWTRTKRWWQRALTKRAPVLESGDGTDRGGVCYGAGSSMGTLPSRSLSKDRPADGSLVLRTKKNVRGAGDAWSGPSAKSRTFSPSSTFPRTRSSTSSPSPLTGSPLLFLPTAIRVSMGTKRPSSSRCPLPSSRITSAQLSLDTIHHETARVGKCGGLSHGFEDGPLLFV